MVKNDLGYVLRKETLSRKDVGASVPVQTAANVDLVTYGIFKYEDGVVKDTFDSPGDRLEAVARKMEMSVNLSPRIKSCPSRWAIRFRIPDDFPEIETDRDGTVTVYRELSQREQEDFVNMLAGRYMRPPVTR